MQTSFRRLVAGAAALAAVLAVQLATPSAHAAPAGPESSGINATAWWGGDGDYVAKFHHTGSKGETLEVFDHKSDGYAAVAYVEFESGDTDRFVMSTGYREYNLREGDSGEYDVPENQIVLIMVCRGYKSIPGDNCSEWELGIS